MSKGWSEKEKRNLIPVVGGFGPSSFRSRSEGAVSLSVLDGVLEDSGRVGGRIFVTDSESSHRQTLVADL